jgi:hypothetical protein
MESIKRKRLFLACCFLLFSVTSYAQTFAEWFSQGKTQKKYLLQQIAALQVYAGYLKKGHEIVGSGINTVRDIKNGELGQHTAFFNSLKAVNPGISNSAKVIDIMAFSLSISKSFNAIGSNNYLSADDEVYISRVKSEVQSECNKDLDELLLVITSGKVEMTDDERLKRLDKVYESMKDKSAFTQSFCNQIALLIGQRRQEAGEIGTAKQLYGITQ